MKLKIQSSAKAPSITLLEFVRDKSDAQLLESIAKVMKDHGFEPQQRTAATQILAKKKESSDAVLEQIFAVAEFARQLEKHVSGRIKEEFKDDVEDI